jgi:hypothetical protein
MPVLRFQASHSIAGLAFSDQDQHGTATPHHRHEFRYVSLWVRQGPACRQSALSNKPGCRFKPGCERGKFVSLLIAVD